MCGGFFCDGVYLQPQLAAAGTIEFSNAVLRMFFKHALALTLEGAAFGLAALFCAASVYINGGGGTFTLVVVGTVVGFAVDLDGLTAAAAFGAVHGTLASFPEAAAGCFLSIFCAFAHHINFSSGTEHVFIVSTGSCGTF